MEKNYDRRTFLKTGSIAVAGTMVLPTFLKGCGNMAHGTSPLSYQLNDYLSHFGVTREMIMKVVGEGLSRGGDYCDLYFQHHNRNSVSLEDNTVNRAYSNVSFGLGIRVLSGEQTGYSFTEEISLESMKSAARTAANIADANPKVTVMPLSEKQLPSFYPINQAWEEVSITDKITFLQKINEKTFALDPRVIKTNVSFSDETSYVLFANSEGVIACDYQPMSQLSAYCVAEENNRKEENGYSISSRRGFDFFTPAVIDDIATRAVNNTILLFESVVPKAGEMPVVLGAGSSGILLHEAIGHGMEADFNRREESIFSDKIGKKVAEPFINIVDDGTIANHRGSINMDDEGNDSQKTFMVENGILTSYLHDRISARHYKVKPTGNGRRESFRHHPLPRMRNTYMLNGPHKREEIIESVQHGIFAESFTNGQVKIGPGDFTFYVKQGYLIENGKITQPIKDVNIIGNGPRVLADITMVADDMELSNNGWMCGKGGQGVPASLGQPTVKVAKLTVGGMNA